MLPFQRSTNDTRLHGVTKSLSQPAPKSKYPTATQAVADMHDTLLSEVSTELATVGVRWIDHFKPFQRSTTDEVAPRVEGALESPTATHAVADAHQTPLSWVASLARGARWIDHLMPAQRSTNGAASVESPTN